MSQTDLARRAGVAQSVISSGIVGWAHEMHAWFALTAGDYRGVIEAGQVAAGRHSVAIQLIAQEAWAYARMRPIPEMRD